jgi:hypothetical protein
MMNWAEGCGTARVELHHCDPPQGLRPTAHHKDDLAEPHDPAACSVMETWSATAGSWLGPR